MAPANTAQSNPVSADKTQTASSAAPISVMIVDDSLVARRVLQRILEEDGRFTVVGCHSGANDAIAALGRTACDIILLDLEMPGRSGVDSLPEMLSTSRNAKIVILSGHHAEDGSVAIAALAAGARDVMTKPIAGHFGPAFASALADRLSAIFTGQDRVAWTGDSAPRRVTALPGIAHAPRAIGIGASTGGIHALTAFLAALDETPGVPIPAPIFVTQHLPADFLPFFAEQLRRQARMPVHVAEEGMPVLPGNLYIAPGQAHLTVTRKFNHRVAIRLSRASSRHGAFPAVDPMLASLAEVYGEKACGLVFSGMGRDGLVGAEAIVCSGGSVIAQDSTSSVVWGMPGAVVDAGLACLTTSPERAAKSLLEIWKAAGA
jgi:two-component system chemotaxis response regulator CheB